MMRAPPSTRQRQRTNRIGVITDEAEGTVEAKDHDACWGVGGSSAAAAAPEGTDDKAASPEGGKPPGKTSPSSAAAAQQRRERHQRELLLRKKAERRAHAKQRKQQQQQQQQQQSLHEPQPQTKEDAPHQDKTDEDAPPDDPLPPPLDRHEATTPLEHDGIEEARPGTTTSSTATTIVTVDRSDTEPVDAFVVQWAPEEQMRLARRGHEPPTTTTDSPMPPVASSLPGPVAEAAPEDADTDYSTTDPQHPHDGPRSTKTDVVLQSIDNAPMIVVEPEPGARPSTAPKPKAKKPKPRNKEERESPATEIAATTIQKAMRKSLLKRTRRTLKKATSYIRHSSKVLAIESLPPSLQQDRSATPPPPRTSELPSAAAVLPLTQSHRPSVVPPLNLPQRPFPTRLTPRASEQSSARSSGSSRSSGRASSSLSSSSSRDSRSSSSASRSSSASTNGEPSPAKSTVQRHRGTRRQSHRRRRRESSGSSSSCSTDDPSPHRVRRRKPSRLAGPSLDLVPTAGTIAGCSLASKSKRQRESPDQKYTPTHHAMATRIQARIRGVRGRRLATKALAEQEQELREEALRDLQEEASVRIQAIVKGFLLRQRLESDETIAPRYRCLSQERRTSHHRHRSRHHHHHKHRHRVAPDETPSSRDRDINSDKQEVVSVWPEELDLEHQDTWDELNSVVNAVGDRVTTARFLAQGQLRVFCGTWNLHAKRPEGDLRMWIPLNRYHIIAIGTEECVHSIAKSVVFTSKKPWEDQLRETLGDEYVLVASHSLTAIHNAVFVHESVFPFVKHVQSDAVATGLGNQLGNKGGVGIALEVGRTSFVFVNCHFDAHQGNVKKRNANFHRINQELALSPSSAGLTTSRRASASSRRRPPVSEAFDRVFWFGDLNYRINGTRRMIDRLLLQDHHAVLRGNDQLQLEMQRGHVFDHFCEGPLHFRPTYKFDKRSNVYDSSPKQRIPSWTDRVLYRSNTRHQDVEVVRYRSHMSFQTSDHRPVSAVFHVQFTQNPDVDKQQAPNEFSRVLARGYRPQPTKSEVCCVQ